MTTFLRILFAASGLVILPTEVYCVSSALATQGEVMQALLKMLLWANVLWVGLFWWFPRAALAGLLAIGLLIIPYQVALLDRLTRLNAEMARLVDARLRLRAEGKPIPLNLDDYTFSDPRLRRFVYSYKVENDGRDFFLHYFVVQPGITHSYSSKTGWFYYPD
jgi:hypothetical protein